MAVALNDDELKVLRMKLKQGDYDGVDIMHAWLAIDELVELRAWREKAFQMARTEAMRGEFICGKCGLRKDADKTTTHDF